MMDGLVVKIDMSKVVVYLLMGEYDVVMFLVVSVQIVQQIFGVIFQEMKGFGYFFMFEDLDVFFVYFELVF